MASLVFGECEIRGNNDKRSEEYECCFHEVTDYKDIVIMAGWMRHPEYSLSVHLRRLLQDREDCFHLYKNSENQISVIW